MTDPGSGHAKYVEDGGCPWHEGKVWCNDVPGHVQLHWATRLNHDGSKTKVILWWADND